MHFRDKTVVSLKFMQKPTRDPSRKLKTLVIEPFKQFRIGLWVIGFSVIFLMTAISLYKSAYAEQYSKVAEHFNVVGKNLEELNNDDIFEKNYKIIAGVFIIYLVLLISIVLYFTHKVYGPLVSIERFIGELSEGDYSKRIRLRKKDDMQRLAGKLNDLAKSLEDRHK